MNFTMTRSAFHKLGDAVAALVAPATSWPLELLPADKHIMWYKQEKIHVSADEWSQIDASQKRGGNKY